MTKPYTLLARKHGWDPQIAEKVWSEAQKQQVDPFLVMALVFHESGFKPAIVHRNKDGSKDYGLFQLNSRYHPQFVDDVDAHIEYGVNHLRALIERYGLQKGLGAYNAGASQAAVGKRKVYIGKIMPLAKKLRSEYVLMLPEDRRNL